MLSGKRVLLIVGGASRAYKTPELVRLIRKAGACSRHLTKAGAEFVTPLTLASLTGEKVHDALFSLTDEIEMGHIELSRAAGSRGGRARNGRSYGQGREWPCE